jgi:hypothetical protein
MALRTLRNQRPLLPTWSADERAAICFGAFV